ncbi:MAG: glycoside hydrolase family 3 protein [Prevotellaceae bacterium]|jgi:beta-N-acetylhexosaminidase|nr:glycoside hydrolase family 3 protein [Prevotellaceae bacterium]
MMKKLFFIIVLLVFAPCFSYAQDTVNLRRKVAQMLIVGFRGTELKKDNPIYKDIAELNIGGVILFDYDVPSKTRPRNIRSPKQVQQLNSGLQNLAGGRLFISIDQEGGYVNRLKERNGFPPARSAKNIGAINNIDSTSFWASQTAITLHELGFNLNFAPNTDVNINPQSPVIGKVERSFSANPRMVAEHARAWILQQSEHGIMNAIKHFPGHGSATADTHLGMADVSNSWSDAELIPFQTLIDSGIVDMVMTSHIINRKLDSVPATLSYNILTKLLREQMHYNGIIISDDIAMGAIANHYPLENALEKAINAGVDISILSNNGQNFDPKIATKAVDIICSLVEQGKITPERIDEAYNRIMSLKYKNRLNVNPGEFTPHKYYLDNGKSYEIENTGDILHN